MGIRTGGPHDQSPKFCIRGIGLAELRGRKLWPNSRRTDRSLKTLAHDTQTVERVLAGNLGTLFLLPGSACHEGRGHLELIVDIREAREPPRRPPLND